MKSINKRITFLSAIVFFGILTSIMLLLFGVGISEVRGQIFLSSAITATVITAVLCLYEFRKLRMVRVITDNQILHIRTAIISNISTVSEQMLDTEITEVIISYFGILMDKKIIKFNQNGIRLRAVENGDDFISFTYGTEKRIQKVLLLRQALGSVELDNIIERFRYETGITPTITAQRIEYKKSSLSKDVKSNFK